jgi:hypothetical protein
MLYTKRTHNGAPNPSLMDRNEDGNKDHNDVPGLINTAHSHGPCAAVSTIEQITTLEAQEAS